MTAKDKENELDPFVFEIGRGKVKIVKIEKTISNHINGLRKLLKAERINEMYPLAEMLADELKLFWKDYK